MEPTQRAVEIYLEIFIILHASSVPASFVDGRVHFDQPHIYLTKVTIATTAKNSVIRLSLKGREHAQTNFVLSIHSRSNEIYADLSLSLSVGLLLDDILAKRLQQQLR